ncbi:hypothetical protein KAH37_02460 [bacterium]|nr:hypothetical protein [bacterium]
MHKSLYTPPHRLLFLFIIVVAFIHLTLSLYVQKSVLQNTPVSGDESSMVFQGELFAGGEIYHPNSCPQASGIFKRHHVVMTRQKEYSKYPPGMALLFASAMRLGNKSAGAANLLASLLSLLLLTLIVWKTTRSPLATMLVSLLYTFASTTAFHAASWFSHSVPLLGALLLTLLLTLPYKKHYLGGIIGGILLFFRPLDAVLLLAAFGTTSLFFAFKEKKNIREIYKTYLFMALFFALFSLLYLLYHYIYTGNPLLSPYALYRHGNTLHTGEKLGEIQLKNNYFSNGLLALTPLWLESQLLWSTLLLPLALFAPFLWNKSRIKEYNLVLIFSILSILFFIFGYAIHNSPGGDSFGARYYFPALGGWFILVTLVIAHLTELLSKTHKIVVITMLLIILFSWFSYDFHRKTEGIRKKTNLRLYLFKETEKALPKDEKALVLIRLPFSMDPSWYVRQNPFEENRIIYGAFPWNRPDLIAGVQTCFSDRKIYILNYPTTTAVWQKVDF